MIKAFLGKQNSVAKKIKRELDAWLSRRPCDALTPTPSVSECKAFDDDAVVARLISSYKSAVAKHPEGDSMWSFIASKHHELLHDALIASDTQKVKEILANPTHSNIMYGFDTSCKEFRRSQMKSMQNMCNHIQDYLLSLCESVGVIPLFNPESLAANPKEYLSSRANWDGLETDVLIDLLNNKFGVELSFKEVFPGEIGLKSGRGTIPHRAVMALYLASRLRHIVSCFMGGREDISICELGAGTGRSAYFAYQLGIKNYSIVDIPFTATISGFFLAASCGAANVAMPGEDRSGTAPIKIMHPEGFLETNEKYDIIVSMDSFTEFGKKTAECYTQKILEVGKSFLSINHEMNEVVVRDQMRESGWKNMYRYPCWIRPGYVEEFWLR